MRQRQQVMSRTPRNTYSASCSQGNVAIDTTYRFFSRWYSAGEPIYKGQQECLRQN